MHRLTTFRQRNVAVWRGATKQPNGSLPPAVGGRQSLNDARKQAAPASCTVSSQCKIPITLRSRIMRTLSTSDMATGRPRGADPRTWEGSTPPSAPSGPFPAPLPPVPSTMPVLGLLVRRRCSWVPKPWLQWISVFVGYRQRHCQPSSTGDVHLPPRGFPSPTGDPPTRCSEILRDHWDPG